MFCPWNVGRSLVQEVVLSMPGDESSGIDPFAFLTTVKDQLEAQMASAVSEVKDMSSTVDILSSDLRKSVANLFAGSTHHTKWLCVTDVRLQALQWLTLSVAFLTQKGGSGHTDPSRVSKLWLEYWTALQESQIRAVERIVKVDTSASAAWDIVVDFNRELASLTKASGLWNLS